ncbi:hypothetical protein FY534_09315 [Alicyclobacillus sp. TC]|uniref:SAM-dependent MidA family methyltransferase n=1 Tax=Alicyclobacillus tolerans TaxID=90970 RepID=A0ABT9LVU7_9BACL|nr:MULTISPECIES: SAM-dependent methyltransferase [Alicyclobacillus]MDP9728367.1 SAM-dependent MidA family methyltransferase [Alicyclobacillus tengchongensis]QRF23835.1 hypothetical protein FY534_09315 [Alicyclobacillus sp. TC]
MSQVSYAAWMRHQLLGWSHGYYRHYAKIGGVAADFFTASHSVLFAEVIFRFCEQWVTEEKLKDFQIVEFGPGEGYLAYYLISNWAERLQHIPLYYQCVEPSPRLRQHQEERLRPLQGRGNVYISFSTPFEVLKNRSTLVLANEVLDALPVERVKKSSDGWYRAYVNLSNEQPAVDIDWRKAPGWLAILCERWLPIPVGAYGEFCPELCTLLAQMCHLAHQGRCLLFDYGITSRDWASGAYPEGTLRGYRQHQLVDISKDSSFQGDWTADVHWDYVNHLVRRLGFASRMQTQAEFLLEGGLLEIIEMQQKNLSEFSAYQMRNEAKRLLWPGDMGERFSVMTIEPIKKYT